LSFESLRTQLQTINKNKKNIVDLQENYLKEKQEFKKPKLLYENEPHLSEKMNTPNKPLPVSSNNHKIKMLMIRPTIEENRIRLSKKIKQNLKPKQLNGLNERNEILINSTKNEISKNEKPRKEDINFINLENSDFLKKSRKQRQVKEDVLVKNPVSFKELNRERSEILIDLIANEKLIEKMKLKNHLFFLG